jgi:hypothetical protein
MSAKELANAYLRALLKREQSYQHNSDRYSLSFGDAAQQTGAGVWTVPVSCLLTAGYCDAGEWALQHADAATVAAWNRHVAEVEARYA